MTKLTRLNQLTQQLERMTHSYSLEQLAERFECSPRTLRRDIEQLVLDYNAPWIISDNQVYWSGPKHEKVHLAGYWFTTAELQAMLVFYNSLKQLQHGLLAQQLEPYKHHIETLLGKQGGASELSQKIKIIEIATSQLNQQIFNTLAQALSNQQRLKIKFWSRHTNEVNEREISPQQLIRYRDHWLLDAYCHHRQAIRSFSLEAINQAWLLDQPAHNLEPKQLKHHFETSYGIFAGQADQQAVLKFSAYQARWTQFEIWHPKQTTSWLEDGSYQITLPYKNDTELIQDILKYGPDIEVLAPSGLRQKVVKRLEETLKQYSSDRN
ncbi:WYL domain-containing protein [Thiomicrospira sp. R3]|uniref:helix-turn-helix transcriptional regulator n=1 Tax=Thiomicrospira sp. R3 TaxID=3035472 RepID=UPI00259AF2E5|nr:WYL domain-containing protein [Thiomicrospira sp. R3]WFE67789.1 WYL domain-containing protein [Thiomicrospira sp. R3]